VRPEGLEKLNDFIGFRTVFGNESFGAVAVHGSLCIDWWPVLKTFALFNRQPQKILGKCLNLFRTVSCHSVIK
jgi:hypothetical protein